MSYDYNISKRIIEGLSETLNAEAAKGKKNIEINDELLERVVKENLTKMDCLYLLTVPDRSNAKFQWGDKEIDVLTFGLRGEAKELMRQQLKKAEERVNERIAEEALKCFNTFDSLFNYVDGNEQVLNMMSDDYHFKSMLLDKMEMLVNIQKAKDKSLNKVESFIEQNKNLFLGRVEKSQSEWGNFVRKKIDHACSGELNGEEIRDLFGKKEELKPYEESRFFGTRYSTFVSGWLSMELRKKLKGVKTVEEKNKIIKESEERQSLKRLAEMEKFTLTMWEGIRSGYQKFGEAAFDRRMFLLYYTIFYYCKDERLCSNEQNYKKDKEFRDQILKKIIDNASPKEIDYLIHFCDRMMTRSAWSFEKKYLIDFGNQFFSLKEEQYVSITENKYALLKCVNGIEYLKRTDLRASDDNRLSIALLLFIKSVKEKNIQGLQLARTQLKATESVYNIIAPNREISGSLRIFRYAKHLLEKSDLELFINNYAPIHPFEGLEETPKEKNSEQLEIDVEHASPANLPSLSKDSAKTTRLLIGNEEPEQSTSVAEAENSKDEDDSTMEELYERISKLKKTSAPTDEELADRVRRLAQPVTIEELADRMFRLRKLDEPGSA